MTDGPSPAGNSRQSFGADDLTAINTIRFLAVDMVEQAKSGHPGAPLGQAALAYVLWTRFLRCDPSDPSWCDRDRFVLSCGHASALLYALLHLAGYDLPLAELEQFRQLGSKTPGHPEFGHTPGVETTTGPLGQGVANAVGFAIAQRQLADRFNREGFPLFSFRTWVLASDGDLMEGVAAEASSLAGHLRLGSLKVLYDANEITIDGSTSLSFTEDVAARYVAYGWNVLKVADGNDLDEVAQACAAAEAEAERPTLVVVRTHIGFGSPNRQDSAKAHGEPLGAEERALTKTALGWPQEPNFRVPPEAPAAFAGLRERGSAARAVWQQRREAYGAAHPELAAELARRQAGELPAGWEEHVPGFTPADGAMATRAASGKVLNALAAVVPELTGGSADLAGSNNTTIKGEPLFSATTAGRNFAFGVREHAMGAVMNGMALTGLLRPYGGTFLIFSDYMRPPIRLAALMGLGPIYVFTHDSIFLGEDGPTHQPVAELAALRAIPNLCLLRPADANETAAAWRIALTRRQGPTALALSRQALPTLAETTTHAAVGVPRGGYVLADWSPEVPADSGVILLATGSEVSLALQAKAALGDAGVRVRVVSLPSWDLFAAQPDAYRDEVLPPAVTRRLGIEAGVSLGWHRWVGCRGDLLTIDRFGASGPQAALAKAFSLTVEEVVARAQRLLSD